MFRYPSANTFLFASIAGFILVVVFLGITKVSDGTKCSAYQDVTGRETKFVADTCYVKFEDTFYTPNELLAKFGSK